MPSRRPHASGRGGTGAARYRRNRAILLSRPGGDRCALCGHSGAATADHIIPDKLWPRDASGRKLPGFDELPNLQPAHGSLGNTGAVNRCPEPTCRLACNQVRGARMVNPRAQSRRW